MVLAGAGRAGDRSPEPGEQAPHGADPARGRVAHPRGGKICHFTTAVFDLTSLGDNLDHEAPKSDPRYYFRPFKTILVRTVADGGQSYYVQGDHKATVPALYEAILKECFNAKTQGRKEDKTSRL